MEYLEYRKNKLSVSDHRKHKTTNSLGVYDIYKAIRKNKWFNIERPLKESEFYKIIRLVNTYLGEELLMGNEIELPCRMGKLELRKYKQSISYKDGKLKVHYPVDWQETLKLWFEDKEAEKNKTLVRNIQKECLTYYYNTYNANYNNKTFFQFKLNRELRKAIAKRFKKGYIDTFII